MDIFKVEECTAGIKSCLSKAKGSNMFLSDMLGDCTERPEVAATFIKRGLMQPKLEAIHALLGQAINEIEKNAEVIEAELGMSSWQNSEFETMKIEYEHICDANRQAEDKVVNLRKENMRLKAELKKAKSAKKASRLNLGKCSKTAGA